MEDLVRTVVREDIRALNAYPVPAAERMIKLDAMENPYALSTALRARLSSTLGELTLNRYPSPSASQLKHQLGALMGLNDTPAMVLGNGSDELIQMLALAVAKPGAVILGVEPSFVMFRLIAQLAQVTFVGVPLDPDFSLNGPALLEAIARHRPALTFLAYPNNPTGNCFDAQTVEAVIQASPGLVVVDEAYYPFTTYSFKDRLGHYPNLLLMRTLSKLGLAGVRLGWLCGPVEVLAEIDKVRLPYNISVLDQAAAVVMLEHRAELQTQVEAIVQERMLLAASLKALAPVTVFPSAANFLLFRVPRAGQVFDGLRHHGILIKNLSQAHPLLHDCLRVTVGTPDENLAFLDALSRVLDIQ
ncbi:MAG: histidinol-phosphate transaminase [Ferrovum myxofaciens]|uniref:histidinol-phosphate transaminase n=1 Tax=Ferrovum myxofaciens TaxID=416213 RepID=UPI0023520419|nr:histidinol-phosphate transaminase [Ferrovum myxofaciens]QKE41181.1 MAG: histidinol-phosphate transaminase [Ferrovum myxofaciens]